MLAVQFRQPEPAAAIRCHACRYFSLERCCNASARLEGRSDRDDECPHFRFSLGASAPGEWQLR